MDPESLLGIEGGLSAPGPSRSKPFLTLLKTGLPKTDPKQSEGDLRFCFLLSQRHSCSRAQLGREIRYIIKVQEFCKIPLTLHLRRPHTHSSAHRYHRVCENRWSLVSLSTAEEGMWNVGPICYQSQLVFPADAHRPGVAQPRSCTSCGRICQDCWLMPLTFVIL